MRDSFLPFARPLIGDDEIEGVMTCLKSGWLTMGQLVARFEKEFAAFTGARHAVAVSSCTAGLHLALESIGVGPGDEVITTPMTFTATGAVIEHLGAKPVFVDCDPDTLNIEPDQVEAAVTSRTRAIMPVHHGGEACDLEAIMAIAGRHEIRVIEDAAHAIPTRYQGRMVGAIGDLTCFSFYATKNLTTGEGGMVTTENDAWADRLRLMRLHGMSRDAWKRYTKAGSWRYEIVAPGFKYNLTDIAAAIGIPQLARCEEFHARRLAIARRYDAAFSALSALQIPTVRSHSDHAWHLYVVQVQPERIDIDRDAFIRELTERNIGTSVHFIPLHLHPYWRDRHQLTPAQFPGATRAFERIISLPIYAAMSDRDVGDVIEAVTEISRSHSR
jgi:perosamine synthetase